jgi:uncharacterized protein (DUF697 family)
MALPAINVNKLKDIYDEVMGEVDKTITLAIVGRNGAGKAETGAWFLLDRASMMAGEIADILMCGYAADTDSQVSAVARAAQADIVIFVVDAGAREFKSDMAVWKAVKDMGKPYVLVGNKADMSDLEPHTARHRLADIFGASLSQIALISALHGTGVLEELLPRVVSAAHDVEIALARRFPVFRKAVASRIIKTTAAENAVLGTLIFLPAADMPVMTANQAKMILKIAVAYGQEIGLDRLKELIVVFGAAVAFRAAARNVAAFVPVLGWAVKGGIAYGGTIALGKTAIKYFENDAVVRIPGARALKAGQDIIDV